MDLERLRCNYIGLVIVRRTVSSLPSTLAIAILTVLLVVLGTARAATSLNVQSGLGINLSSVNYYSSEQPLLNVFKTNGGWITHSSSTWDTSEERYLQLDENGYPTTLTASSSDPHSPQLYSSVGVLLDRANGQYPGGQYIVLYDGEGTLSYGFDAKLVNSSPGRDVISVTPSAGGIDLRITATDPNHTGNYIRNIRVVQAAYEAALDAGQIFSPMFLNLVKDFRVLRFMDWLQTNGSTLSSWTNRPTETYYSWGGANGVPIEVAVALTNAISADAWLNVPAMADDNYITQMATLVKGQIGATQNVYVEYSNEVWNPSFSQYSYAGNQGQALWPSLPSGGGNFAYNRNWYGMRTAQMCDIWRSVWGASANRVICVLGAQAANTYTATEALACPYWTAGQPCSGHGIGAVAIAPYFGGTLPSAWTSQSDGGLSDLFTSLTSQNDPSVPAGGWFNRVLGFETSYVTAMAPYHLPLITYEGGQSFVTDSSNDAALTNLYIAANRDPRMASAYTTYLQQWKANGGELFVLYNDIDAYSQYGEWGALESIMQTTSPLSNAPPKWQAIQGFLGSTTCWWSSCKGTLVASPMPPSGVAIN